MLRSSFLSFLPLPYSSIFFSHTSIPRPLVPRARNSNGGAHSLINVSLSSMIRLFMSWLESMGKAARRPPPPHCGNAIFVPLAISHYSFLRSLSASLSLWTGSSARTTSRWYTLIISASRLALLPWCASRPQPRRRMAMLPQRVSSLGSGRFAGESTVQRRSNMV